MAERRRLGPISLFAISPPHRHNMEPRLPPELIEKFINHVVDYPSLLSLCLTSWSFHEEASKHIYRHIDDLGSTDALPHLRLLETLISNPKLASLVHAYTSDRIALSMDPDAVFASHALTSAQPDQDVKRLRQRWRIWNILPRALLVMDNLKLFRFRSVDDRRSAH